MKRQVSLSLVNKGLLTVAACMAIGGGFYAPAALAVATPAVQTAKSVVITGVVTDAQGEPLIGASVIVKGSAQGVVTDVDGRFSINATVGQDISISSIGYKSRVVKASQGGMKIVLDEDTELLNDVVVIGYGTQRKGDVTSAVSSIKSEDFTVGSIGDAAELVKGKVAGLTIAKGSGDPNDKSTIRLRGVISLEGSTTPLVLIDGIEGGLGTVAPENIASIDVLKDASAAAIYGTRGANGVILITTKSGVRDSRTTATYSGYASLSNMGKKHKMMTAAQIREGLTSYTDRGHDTDWLDAISRTAFTQNHDFQINGGSKSTTYAGGVNYRHADGVIINTFNDELKMNFDLSHWFFNDMVKVHLNMVKGIHNNSPIGVGGGGDANIYLQALMHNPTEPIKAEDGTWFEDFSRLYYYNPVAMIKEKKGSYKSEWTRMTGDITLEPIKGWQTTLMLSTNRSNSNDQAYYTSQYYSEKSQNHTGNAYQSYGYGRTDNLEATSRYRQTFELKHRFEALIGYSWQQNSNMGFSAWNRDFMSDFFEMNNMGLGMENKNGKAGMSSYRNESRLIGFFGRVSYGYDDRYNILISMRREGSSKFGANHKWGNFPSASLGWNTSNEKFWKEAMPAWFETLRFRAGYGVTGVIPGSSYMSLTRYQLGSNYFYDNGKWVQGLEVASNPNPNLKWETSHEVNVGVDWAMFNNRLSGSVDVYNKSTRDMLWWYDVPVPPNLYPQTLANVGEMRNRGVEVLVSGTPVKSRDFEWTSTVTFSHNANKLISLSNGLYETANVHAQGGLGQPISQATHRLEVGKPVGQYFGLKSVGVSENGLWMIELPDGTVTEITDAMLADDNAKQYLGNGLPKFYYGWNNTFRYKTWDLSMQFTGQSGFKVLNDARAFYENNSIAYNKMQSVLEAPYGDRTLAGNQKQTFVSYYLEDGDFFKLTNLTLGYTVPFKPNPYVKSLRAYAAAENLFCLTKYKGLDPELSNGYAPSAGIEYRDKYPTIRSYTVGINITF